MKEFSIFSERVIELCSDARPALSKLRSRGFPNSVLLEMRPFTYDDAAETVDNLEQTARAAIAIAGAAQSSVVISNHDFKVLHYLLSTPA